MPTTIYNLAMSLVLLYLKSSKEKVLILGWSMNQLLELLELYSFDFHVKYLTCAKIYLLKYDKAIVNWIWLSKYTTKPLSTYNQHQQCHIGTAFPMIKAKEFQVLKSIKQTDCNPKYLLLSTVLNLRLENLEITGFVLKGRGT